MPLNNPFDILGIPQDVVARIKETGDLESLRALARTYYLALSKIFHSDVPVTGDQKVMAELSEAYEELTDPIGLRSAVNLYVGSAATHEVRQRRGTRERVEYDERLPRALASMLTAVDQLGLLGVSQPVRFIARLATPAFGGQFQYTFRDVMVGEVTPAGAKLWRTRPVRLNPELYDPERPDGFGLEVEYDADRKGWLSVYQTEDMSLHRHFHDDLILMNGTFRLAGGADYNDLYRTMELVYGSTASVDMLLIKQAAPTELSWAKHENDWWLRALQPQARIGDYLVIVDQSGDEPSTMLVGPILDIQPL